MKNKIISILLVALFFLPIIIFADTKEYITQNLEEALTEEKIEHNLKDYKESEDKINIYLFRGNGCTYCNNFLKFLNENIEEYGKYFNLVSYEVFSNQNNSSLLTKVSTFIDGTPAVSVPYIIIGKESFSGFNESTSGEKIKTVIKELYENKDRYDVFEEMEVKDADTKDNTSTIIVWNLVFISIATLVMLYVNDRHVKVLNARIDALENSLHKKK